MNTICNYGALSLELQLGKLVCFMSDFVTSTDNDSGARMSIFLKLDDARPWIKSRKIISSTSISPIIVPQLTSFQHENFTSSFLMLCRLVPAAQ